MKTQLSIQERLKDLRVEKGMTLEQLSQQTKIPASTLGSYESDDIKKYLTGTSSN
ncbi:MAG: helix-turn-helix domain-containing protein [Lachnospiraceae bacterium]|nr:helix-turn-helix domain-containing protein [Lachnospiraceae bacterium]